MALVAIAGVAAFMARVVAHLRHNPPETGFFLFLGREQLSGGFVFRQRDLLGTALFDGPLSHTSALHVFICQAIAIAKFDTVRRA